MWSGSQLFRMNKWLRIGGWAALALIALWVVFEVVSLLLGFLSWVVGTVVSLLVVALLLYLTYLAVSKLFGGSGGSGGSRSRSQSREKERVFE